MRTGQAIRSAFYYGANVMPISKICSRCGRRVPTGRPCPCVAVVEKSRHRIYNKTQRNKKAEAFYNTKAWRDLSRRVLQIDGCDVYLFMTRGVIELPDTVHHIIPIMDDWDKRLQLTNLISLSHSTHSMIERKYRTNKAGMQAELQALLEHYRELIGYDPYDL